MIAALTGQARSGRSTLSSREVEVLALLAQCFTDAETAKHLGIAPITVKSHVAHIKTKLGLYRRPSLVLYAVKAGLVRLDDVVLR